MIQNPALFALASVVNEVDPTIVGGSFAQDCVVTKGAGAGDYIITFNRVVDHGRMAYKVTPTGPVGASLDAMVEAPAGPSNQVIVHVISAPAVPPGQGTDSRFCFMAHEISPSAVL